MSAGEPNNTHDFTTSLYGSSCTVICVLMGSTLVFPFQDIEHHVGHGGASPPGLSGLAPCAVNVPILCF